MRFAKAGTTSKSLCSVYRVRLQIRRLGGIAGVRLRAELDTSDLPADQAAAVEDAVRGLRGHLPSGPPRPDAFRYEITRLDERDSPAVSIDERDIPPVLAAAIAEVAKSADIEGPNRKANPG